MYTSIKTKKNKDNYFRSLFFIFFITAFEDYTE